MWVARSAATGALARFPASAQGTSAEFIASMLSIDELKELCQIVMAEIGWYVEGVRRYGRYTDLELGSTVLLRPRKILVRLLIDVPTSQLLEELAAESVDRAYADFLLVTTRLATDVAVRESEHVLGPEEFLGMCRQSYAVGWKDSKPVPRVETYKQLRSRMDEILDLDRFGLGWLPALSRNRLPWQLRGSAVSPDEWFELLVFRIATALFRLDGVRLGSATRGRREGDAFLWRRADDVALLDCKAAQDGYRLDANNERALLEYVRTGASHHGIQGKIGCVVLISSSFPVFDSAHRNFESRRRKFTAEGSGLACIRADDLVDAGLMVLRNSDNTESVEAIRWDLILAEGLITRKRLLAMCKRGLGRA